jgi:predicted dehydrogenase
MDSVRWGVVGAGDVCEKKSGPPLYLVNNSSLELVHRRRKEEGEEFVIRHGRGRYVESFEKLIDSSEIDAVYIATPHALHETQTIAALQAGKHVLVEKPMALDASGCRRMIQAATAAGRQLGVAYYRRGYPSIRKLKAFIESGLIGTPIAASLNNEFPTSHRLDLVHYLFGDIAEAGRGAPVHDDYAPESRIPMITLLTRNGVNVTMAEGWLETGMPESLIIEGEEGIIYLQDLKGGEIQVLARGGEEKLQLSVPGLPFTHWGLIENFVEALTVGAPLLCPGEEGRKSTVLLDRIADSLPGREPLVIRYS